MSSLTLDDRRLIEDSVIKFVQHNYAFDQREQRRLHAEKFGRHWTEFAELGWLALPFSEAVGGLGGGIEEAQLMMVHFGRGLIEEPYTEVAIMAGKVLEHIGSPLLERLISGEQSAILCHREQASVQSLTACNATAVRDGNNFILNGCKVTVSQAGAADYFLVSAMAEGELALFQLPADHQSLQIDEFLTIDSRYAADIGLRDVVIDSSALLCRGDEAEAALRFSVLFTMTTLIGELNGIADELVTQTAEFLKTREQFGVKLFEFQALQHKLADMLIGAEEIKSLVGAAADAMGNEDPIEQERMIRSAKARAAVVARLVGEAAVQLHGGMGVSDEMAISHYLRRIVAIDAFYGDSQCHYAWLSSQYALEEAVQ